MIIDIYARVSTEDQVKNGLSVITQLDDLRAWAKANGHTIAGEYVDAGISGKNPLSKRPALYRWIQEVEAGRKVDALVFTKLDRFFRSVKLYYEATGIMDLHKIGWQAIQEDYETITSAGRFKVNIMLAVAESEADRTSERIKVVFDRKIANGEYLSSHVPIGYSVIDKHLVPNEEADKIRAAFDLYRKTGSIFQTKNLLRDQGHDLAYITVSRLLKNEKYAGRFRDNPAYCEPIIQPEIFDEVQQMRQKRSLRENQTNRVYLFSGLIRCAHCGRTLVGSWHGKSKEKLRYRCNDHYLNGNCPNSLYLKEASVEAFLLDHIATEISSISGATDPPKKKKKSGPDKAAIMAKIDRLKDLYVDGIIDKEQFLTDRQKLLSQLPQDLPAKDLSTARQIILASDFHAQYNELSREDKRTLWRNLIDHMVADKEGNIQLFFLP